jgi:hypothetical protein
MGSSHLGGGSLNKAIAQLKGSGEMLEVAHFREVAADVRHLRPLTDARFKTLTILCAPACGSISAAC